MCNVKYHTAVQESSRNIPHACHANRLLMDVWKNKKIAASTRGDGVMLCDLISVVCFAVQHVVERFCGGQTKREFLFRGTWIIKNNDDFFSFLQVEVPLRHSLFLYMQKSSKQNTLRDIIFRRSTCRPRQSRTAPNHENKHRRLSSQVENQP